MANKPVEYAKKQINNTKDMLTGKKGVVDAVWDSGKAKVDAVKGTASAVSDWVGSVFGADKKKKGK